MLTNCWMVNKSWYRHTMKYHSEFKRIRLLICTTIWMNIKKYYAFKRTQHISIYAVLSHSYIILEEAKIINRGFRMGIETLMKETGGNFLWMMKMFSWCLHGLYYVCQNSYSRSLNVSAIYWCGLFLSKIYLKKTATWVR